MAHVVFIIGNIASGKSTACKYLQSLGARLIDLDVVAKDLYIPGSPIVQDLVDVFGWDILNEDGGVAFSALAARAFETPEATARLNAIVHPAVKHQLATMVFPVACCSTVIPQHELTVVEVSVAAAFTDSFGLADEVIAVTAPLSVRRVRAVERGMSPDDFDARSLKQPDEDTLCSWADVIIENERADDSLFGQLDAWLDRSGIKLKGRR